MINTIDTTNHIINICSNDYLELMSLPNVVGIAFSYKIINNEFTSRECIQVLVNKKLPLNELSLHHIIPSKFRGIETDVYECGEIEAFSHNNIKLECGNSVGPLCFGGVGTLGTIVKSKYESCKNKYILSNNHVLAGMNNAFIGVPILYPSPCDGGSYPENEVASLSKYIPIKFATSIGNQMNLVDCAIAKIKSSPELMVRNLPYGTTSEFVGQIVHKIGRSTGLTGGKIISIGATVKVNYNLNGKKAFFKNQIVTNAMSEKGDSGSLLLDRYNRGVGLLFSGTKKVTLYNRIDDVLSMLNVKLVTKPK